VIGVVALTPSFDTATLRIAISDNYLTDDLLVFLTTLTAPRQLRVYAIMTVLVVVFAVLIWLLERSKNQHFRGKRHEGFGSGLWWSITTLSTVGYGDKVPISSIGRLLASTWMIFSLLLVSIFTATVTSSITVHDTSIRVEGIHDLSRARVGIAEYGLAVGYACQHSLTHISYPTLAEALDELAAGHLDAVIADEQELAQQLRMRKEKRIIVLEQPINRMPICLGLRKTLSRDFIRRFDEALAARLKAVPQSKDPASQTLPSTKAPDRKTTPPSETQS